MAVELCNPRGTLPSNMHMCKYKLTGTETHTHTVAHTINSHTMAEHPLPQAHTVHKQTCKPTGGLGHTGTHPRHACAPTRRAHANTHTHTHTHMHARTLFAASVHTNMCTHTYVNHAMLCEGCRQQRATAREQKHALAKHCHETRRATRKPHGCAPTKPIRHRHTQTPKHAHVQFTTRTRTNTLLWLLSQAKALPNAQSQAPADWYPSAMAQTQTSTHATRHAHTHIHALTMEHIK